MVLCRNDLKFELYGLFAKPEFSAPQGLLVAPLKDSLVV